MVLNQFGSIPHELAMRNIKLMTEQVAPKLRPIWDGEWEDHWWIKPSSDRRAVPPLVQPQFEAGDRDLVASR
jgi:hypothetical protein